MSSATLHIGLLGPLTIRISGGEVLPLSGTTQRRLLSLLALNCGKVVSTQRLCDIFDKTPAALRTVVSRARAELGVSAVVTQPPGYLIDGCTTDVADFDELMETWRRDRRPPAASVLTSALGLWRGDAIAEFSCESWALPAVSRLTELRSAAIEERADAWLAEGRSIQVIAEMDEHVALHPLRERPRAILMQALALEGRLAEAERVFRTFREHLIAEVGTEPSPEIRALERRLMTDGQQPLSPRRSSATTRKINHIPAHRGELIGREHEVSEVRNLLTHHRLVTVTGPGGVGKTRLALQVAEETSMNFDGSAVFIDLSTLPRDGLVSDAFLRAVGSIPKAAQVGIEDVVKVLHQRPSLLIVDNCEHVLDDLSITLRQLLDALPDLTVLATSREPIDIDGEHAWRVPPLPVHHGSAAIHLFVERARERDATFRIDGVNEQRTVDLCARLDGMPLAIELAAARVATMTVAEILRLLDDHSLRLRSTRRDRPERQQTLDGTVAWSYELLRPGERLLLQRLAVFDADFSRDAVAGVCGTDDRDVSDLFDSLVAQSLVSVVRLPRNRLRFKLLGSIRRFALERLEENAPDGLREARDRHLDHFLDVDGAPAGLGVAEIHRRIGIPDFANLRQAANWAVSSGRPADATRLSIGRSISIVEHGAAHEALGWLSHGHDLDVSDQLWASTGQAYCAMSLGDHDAANEYLDDSFEIADGMPFDALPNAYSFAAINAVANDPHRALAFVDAGLEMLDRTPSGPLHLPMVRHTRSWIQLHRRQYAVAIDDVQIARSAAGPTSPFFGATIGLEWLARVATDAMAGASKELRAVARPSRYGAQEWTFRLLDLADAECVDLQSPLVVDAARQARRPTGGDPGHRAADLIAMLAWLCLRSDQVELAERYAEMGRSGSPFGALAYEALGRIRCWADEEWFECRSSVACGEPETAARARALSEVNFIANGTRNVAG